MPITAPNHEWAFDKWALESFAQALVPLTNVRRENAQMYGNWNALVCNIYAFRIQKTWPKANS